MENAIVVPFYNESKRIQISEYVQFLEKENSYRFLFVDDGSTDDTLIQLNILKRRFADRIDILPLKMNLGKAEAVRQGFLYFFKKDKYENIGFIDGDSAIPLEQLSKLVEQINTNGFKAAFTTRYRDKKIKTGLLRNLLSGLIYSITNKLLLKTSKITDTQCGCKLFRYDISKKIFEEPFISRWLFDIEIVMRIACDYDIETKITEVQLEKLNDNYGSKLRYKDYWSILKNYIKIYLAYKS